MKLQIPDIKIKSQYLTILLILIILIINLYVRTIPARLPITDDWAKSNVHGYYRSQIEASVRANYPNLPQQNLNELVNEELTRLYTEQAETIAQQEAQMSQQLKARMQDETGQTYLIAIDPYYYLRHVNHYLEKGQAGTIWTDEIEDKSAIETMWPMDFEERNWDWDGQRMAPIGAASGMTLHTYFGAYLHKIITIFKPHQSTMATMFYVPVILISLAIIPTFMIAKKLAGHLGGFVAAMFFVLNPNLLGRTVAGFSDTDAYTVLFPLMVVWAFLESITQQNLTKRVIWALVSGFFVGLFAFAWVGWWYIFNFMLLGMGIYLAIKVALHFTKQKQDFKDYLVSCICFFGAAAVSVSVFGTYHFKTFLEFLKGPISFISFKAVAVKTLWPTVRTTVAELHSATLEQVINSIGGNIFLIMAILGVVMLVVLKNKDRMANIKLAIVIITWMAGTAWASLSGMRFIILLVPPFAIAMGTFVGLTHKHVSRLMSTHLKVDKRIPTISIAMVSLALFITPMQVAISSTEGEIPSMNDAWYGALTKINNEASEDAIITSWWDFGHWFITIADRQVTFDGGGQDETMAYWVGRSLLTDDEKHSVGILRMLNCGSNNAFRVMRRENNYTQENIVLLNKLVKEDREEALKVLKMQFSDEVADEILRYSHCEPPESYIITSTDMVMKGGVWGHFGSWDFERAAIYMDVKKGVPDWADKYGLTEEQAYQYEVEISTTEADNWIAQWPGYLSNVDGCQETDTQLLCSNGQLGDQRLLVNKSDMSVMPKPVSVVFPSDTGLAERHFDNPDFQFSVAIIPTEQGPRNVLMTQEQSQSLFTRLFFYKGYQIECFELFDFKQQINSQEIYVWKVNWRCLDG